MILNNYATIPERFLTPPTCTGWSCAGRDYTQTYYRSVDAKRCFSPIWGICGTDCNFVLFSLCFTTLFYISHVLPFQTFDMMGDTLIKPGTQTFNLISFITLTVFFMAQFPQPESMPNESVEQKWWWWRWLWWGGGRWIQQVGLV